MFNFLIPAKMKNRCTLSGCIPVFVILVLFVSCLNAQEKIYPFNNAQVRLVWSPLEYTFYDHQGKPIFKTATIKDKDAGSWGLTDKGKTGKFSKVKGLREKIQILLTDIETDKKQLVRSAINDRGNSMSIRFFHLKGNEIDSTGSMSVTFISMVKDQFKYFKDKNGAEGVMTDGVCLLLNPFAKGTVKLINKGKKQFLHFSSLNYDLQVYALQAESKSELQSKKNKLLQILSFR